MKRIIFFIISIITSVFFILSCAETVEVEATNECQQDAFDALLVNIESLNYDFGIVKTKGCGRDAIKASADIAGFVAGNIWGQTLAHGRGLPLDLPVLLSGI